MVLSARRQERLAELESELEKLGGSVVSVPLDLSDAMDAGRLVDSAIKAFSRIDLLVNNAGYGRQCRFEAHPIEDVGAMFDVNVLAPMALARAVIPVMKEQRTGSIINVASVGGHVAHPLNVAYCASKHALVGFSKSLRLELHGTGIRVTAVCPGATRTEFFDVAHDDIPFDPTIERFQASPEVVARAILKASRGNRPVVFPTWSAWFLVWLDKWLPPVSRQLNLAYRRRVLPREETKEPGN